MNDYEVFRRFQAQAYPLTIYHHGEVLVCAACGRDLDHHVPRSGKCLFGATTFTLPDGVRDQILRDEYV